MPKIHIKKGSVSLDMTAMCDVAFLLLTFFVLTAKAKPMEPVEVSTPSSIVDLPVPDVNIITLLMDAKGRTFIGMDNINNSRVAWINAMNDQFKLGLNANQVDEFKNGGPIGMHINEVSTFLGANDSEKKNIEKNSKGIKVDTSNIETNELKDWIINARRANPKASVVIKADSKAPYSEIKNVMKTLRNQGVNRFSLLTSLGKAD